MTVVLKEHDHVKRQGHSIWGHPVMMKSDSGVTTHSNKPKSTKSGQQAARSWKEMKKSLWVSEEYSSKVNFPLDSNPPKLWNNTFLWFRATQWQSLCCSCSGKLIEWSEQWTSLSGMYPGLYFIYAPSCSLMCSSSAEWMNLHEGNPAFRFQGSGHHLSASVLSWGEAANSW